jgi:uncharacterized membrane protein YtjA (UPF0391 family)
MLRLAILFFIVALIAGLFGFTGVAGGAFEAAKIFCFIFLVLAVLSLIFGAFRGTAPPV